MEMKAYNKKLVSIFNWFFFKFVKNQINVENVKKRGSNLA